ncbi:3-phosphoshikimate 1-carboxyvinyltransferase [Thermodesulfobacteriota bacterium]
MEETRRIRLMKRRSVTVHVPGSKSFTHRMLIAAALAGGRSVIRNALIAEDTRYTMNGLARLGASFELEGGRIVVEGTGGRLHASPEAIYLGNSGTSMRFLAAVAAIGNGEYTLTGSPRMQERPVQDLLDALTQLGVRARTVRGNGCPPVTVRGGPVSGGTTDVDCHLSSQYLSSLCLMGPYTEKGLDVRVVQGPVSRPYVDMTLHVMREFGVEVLREGYSRFTVPGGRVYRPGTYEVEPDASNASYFWAAGAASGASVTVKGIGRASLQGDAKFVDVLEKMGCRVDETDDGVTVTGGGLRGIEVDMSDMPDTVPTLAVLAAFARGSTVIRNIGHLREKESDRLGCVVAELGRMGVDARCDADSMTIQGGQPRAARIETYNDHRMAMSFAVAGLMVPGIVITGPMCVKKSFPLFWEVWDQLS